MGWRRGYFSTTEIFCFLLFLSHAAAYFLTISDRCCIRVGGGGGSGRWGGRSKIIRRESLALYKSCNTLWSFHSLSHRPFSAYCLKRTASSDLCLDSFRRLETFTMFICFLRKEKFKPLRIVVLYIYALGRIDKITFMFWWWQFWYRRWKVSILGNIEKRKTNLKMWHRWI